jgi:adenylylsulfate kinase
MQCSQVEAGGVIWITGLSASGKTSTAMELVCKLRQEGRQVAFLDGDELRKIFAATADKDMHYTRDMRLKLAMQYSQLCDFLSKQGMLVVIATISLFDEIHKWNRDNLSNYFEVYLNVPLEELKRRDPKDIYKRFANGELSQVAGLDLVIDIPQSPDLILNFNDNHSAAHCAGNIIKAINEGKYD